MPQSSYSSKLLLFGEYSIIHGGVGLSVPIPQFYGQWSYKKDTMDWSSLFDFLVNTDWPAQIILDQQRLKKDIAQGLFFDANIPQGFGLGSSAALTAAIFTEYFLKKEQISISLLHEILAQIESHFHGRSSGIDPLVSYLNQGVLIHSKIKEQRAAIELVNCTSDLDSHQFFLYDTGMARNTKQLVTGHKNRYAIDQQYRKAFVNLNELNQRAINLLRALDITGLQKEMNSISDLQLDLMSEMIPLQIVEDYKALNLKLCGAGGGGYFLGLCGKDEFTLLQKQYPILKI